MSSASELMQHACAKKSRKNREKQHVKFSFWESFGMRKLYTVTQSKSFQKFRMGKFYTAQPLLH